MSEEVTQFQRDLFAQVDGNPDEGGFAVRPGHSSVVGYINEEVHKVGIDGRPYICKRVWANIATGEGIVLNSPEEDHHHVVSPHVEKVLVSEGCVDVDEFPSFDSLPFDVPEVPAEDPEGRFTLSEGDRIKARRLNAFSAARQYAYAQRDEFWGKVEARRDKEVADQAGAVKALEDAGLGEVAKALVPASKGAVKTETKTETVVPTRGARRVR